ncbi:MAG: alpha/beta hydrolase [Alphaproteobacteria bacterium]|nr:alpha/beta hydrolase [Alphaproteobacteria bacterium]
MKIDQQTASLLNQINRHVAGPGEDATITAARLGAAALFSGFSGETNQAGEIYPECQIEDRIIDGEDCHVPVRIYHPAIEDKTIPIVLFFHGGGWSLGDVASYDNLVRSLCCLSGTIYISVDYRLAPEHKYPAGLRDCVAVSRWALACGATVGGDVSRVAVMGDSAGGNLAIVVAHQINSQKKHQIKGQFLLYPVIDISHAHEFYRSRMTSGNGEYLLSRDGIDAAIEWYLSPGDDRSDPAISPAMQEDLSPTPPTVIVIGGYDPLLDEARQYHNRLTSSGIASIFKCYDSAIHAFLSFGVLDISRTGRRYVAQQVHRLFSK